MVPRLILVEGLPRCGKSTTAPFLASQLNRAGQRARWHYEEETPHPVLQARYTGNTWQGYCDDRLERWTRFAAEVEAGTEVRIVESTLLQTPIMTMLREDVDPGVILAFPNLGRSSSISRKMTTAPWGGSVRSARRSGAAGSTECSSA